MAISARLRDLIDRSAKLWAGEAEIVRTYFHSDSRTRETDRAWLERQCFKEIWGSGLTGRNESLIQGWSKQLSDWFPKIDQGGNGGISRYEALEIAEALHEEFEHYCLFADAYDAMAANGEANISPMGIKDVEWKAEEKLAELRRDHRAEHGDLGWASTRFTEGGYCTLFAEGMALGNDPDGHDGRNGMIAKACRSVYEDEFAHMLIGITEADDPDMSDTDWQTFGELAILQLQHRLPMRNEQFGYPVGETRMVEILNGDIDPLSFDYAKAEAA